MFLSPVRDESSHYRDAKPSISSNEYVTINRKSLASPCQSGKVPVKFPQRDTISFDEGKNGDAQIEQCKYHQQCNVQSNGIPDLLLHAADQSKIRNCDYKDL